MTDHKPRRNTTLTRTSPPPRAPTTFQRPAPTPPKSSASGWVGLLAIVGILFAIGRCTSTGGGDAGSTGGEATTGNAQQAIASAVEAQTPQPVAALSRSAVLRGTAHPLLAAREGVAGEMIYSQNCYDALGRKFTWAKLDACGGFDAEAVLELDEDEGAAQPAELAWFQSEAAAGRFLKAAVAAGESADDADTRWSALQARVAGKHKPRAPEPSATPEPSPSGSAEPAAPADDDEATGNVDV